MTTGAPATLSTAACRVLLAAAPATKVDLTRRAAAAWRQGDISTCGRCLPPNRPARPTRPELRLPKEMPKRGRAGSRRARLALLHALAHIELNAIDLAWDLIARFGAGMPRAFLDDWVRVAAEEAEHFMLLGGRLAALDAGYGDLPAHDGLWQAAAVTADDVLARLAVVPLVLEARGLDVSPETIARLRRAGDEPAAAVVERIYRDEIGHVAVGKRWFDHVCRERGLDVAETWRDLVQRRYRGALKPPFNDDARMAAGLAADLYGPLAADAPADA